MYKENATKKGCKNIGHKCAICRESLILLAFFTIKKQAKIVSNLSPLFYDSHRNNQDIKLIIKYS